MKKILTLVAIAAFAIPFLAPRAEAQLNIIAQAGYDLEMESLFFGGGAEFVLPIDAIPFPLTIRPTFDYFLGESESEGPFTVSWSMWQINGDVIAEIMPASEGLGVFAGAGLAYNQYSVDAMGFDASNSELGLNLLGGIEFAAGALSPFVMARMSTPQTTRFQILGGVKFSL